PGGGGDERTGLRIGGPQDEPRAQELPAGAPSIRGRASLLRDVSGSGGDTPPADPRLLNRGSFLSLLHPLGPAPGLLLGLGLHPPCGGGVLRSFLADPP